MISAAKIATTQREWTAWAGGEPVRVEQIRAGLYGFTTELGALRLLKKYRWAKKASADYSENLKTWFFVIELGADL